MISEILNIETQERKLFKRHFIRNVIVELHFSNLTKDTILKKTEFLKTQFNELGFNQCNIIKQIAFKMNLEDNEPQKTSGEDSGLVFINTKQQKQLEILNNKIICVDNKYENFDFLLEKISKIIKVINHLNLENNNIKHIGFRKINTIISTETDSYKPITNLFNEALFAQLRTKLIPFENFSSYNDSINIKKDIYRCIINTNCTRRNKTDFEINLDFDLIITEMSEKITLEEKLKSLNQLTYDLFLWSITDELKKIMNEGEV